MSDKSILIIAARSDIARATADRFARAGYTVQLAAREAATLDPVRAAITESHGVAVSIHELDVLDTASFEPFIDALPVLPDVVVCAAGLMGTQAENEGSVDAAQRVLRTNFEGPALLLGVFANRFAARGSGVIVGISSVAGERGRATNYVYGSAKAGFTAFLSGLRNRLSKAGVHVVTVLPGFVATRMTEGMDLPARLTAAPEEVGEAIFDAVAKRRNVIYVRRVWWLIMTIIRSIPERIFKTMRL